MTIINQKSISGITSITTAAAGDNLLTFHTNDGTERFRIDNSGSTKITAGIVTTLTVTGNGTVGGTLSVTGETTFATHINLGDSDKAKFGASGDLEIYHDGTNSYIDDTGTGSLNIRGNTGVSLRNYSNSNQFINCYTDGAVELFHNNNKKFETTSSGIDVTGMVQCDQVRTGDDEKIQLGDSQDFRIYHDGSTNIIDGHYHPIELRHQSEVHAKFTDDGSVELYHNNSKKFETTSSGVLASSRVFLGGSTNGGFDYNATADTLEFLTTNGGTHSELTSAAYVPSADAGKDLGHHNKRWDSIYCTGVAFGGNTDAAANLLDDYEEGTWTPTLTVNDSSSGITYGSNNGGSYTKIGRLVYLHVRLELTDKGSGSGAVNVRNLPFAAGDIQSGSSAVENSSSNFGYMQYISKSGYYYLGTRIQVSDSHLRFYWMNFDNGTQTNLSASDIADNTSFACDIMYQTTE